MTKASGTRVEKQLEAKAARAEQSEAARKEEQPSQPEAPEGTQANVEAPIQSDCGICRRAANCMVFQGYQAALQNSLGSAQTQIPGIQVKPSLAVDCPEFDMTPQVEEAVRDQQAKQQRLAAVPDEADKPEE